ncbi:MAG: hypothetical protein ACFFBD_13405 [Candidatus Hodarchaeota archaeon]
MGRKRRKKVRTRPRPSLPTIFECPICEANSIRVEINKNSRTAEIKCGNSECAFSTEVPVKSYEEAVDIYGKWLDEISKEEEEDVLEGTEGTDEDEDEIADVDEEGDTETTDDED